MSKEQAGSTIRMVEKVEPRPMRRAVVILLIAIWAITVFAAVGIGPAVILDIFGNSRASLVGTFGSLLVLTISAGVIFYLDPGLTTRSVEKVYGAGNPGYDPTAYDEWLAVANRLDRRLRELESRQIESDVSDDAEPLKVERVSEQVVAAVMATAPSAVLDKLKSDLSASADMRFNLNEARAVFERGRNRLVEEVQALIRRANVNLTGGASTTMAGIFLLAYFIMFAEKPPSEAVAFGIYFIPKVTLVIFIQAFAYFFLRLYRTSLEEIKFYQNEITTIEQRYVALVSSARAEAAETYAKVIEALAAMDRNPVAAGAERDQLERERTFLQSGIEAIKALAPAVATKA